MEIKYPSLPSEILLISLNYTSLEDVCYDEKLSDSNDADFEIE